MAGALSSGGPKKDMKQAFWIWAGLAVWLAGAGCAWAADPWPAEAPAAAVRLTGLDSGLDTVNWSGASWNPDTRTLWLACNSGAFWALAEDGAGGFQVATNAAGIPAKWVPGGDLEAICQAADDPHLVYLLDENGWIREYDTTQYGVVNATRSWDIRAWCPEVDGASGGEGLTFVPDDWLRREGFRQADGALRTSTNGMGGLMFVGYQYNGYVYAFDLNRATGAAALVGRYQTGRAETAALEFDRATGKLYLWHNTGSNYLEITELYSTPAGADRRLRPLAEYYGPRAGNLEGFALAPGDAGRGGCIVTDDDNLNHEAVLWYRQFQPSDDTDGDGLSDAWELWTHGSTTVAGFAPRRINCGGPALAGAVPWLADTGFLGGGVWTTTAAVANATSAPLALYQRERSSAPLRYSLGGIPNGACRVKLHFNEMSASARAGSRVFHVYLEGARVWTNLDVFVAAGGRLRALVKTFDVNIAGGNGLQLELTRVAGYPQLNGLEIEPAGPPPPAIVASASAVTVPEGATATFSVRLNTAPAGAATVTVVRASGDADLAVAGGASLVFTPANFGAEQLVTLAAAEDADTTAGTAGFQCTAAGYAAASVTATEQENDVPPFALKVNCGGPALAGGWVADTGYLNGGIWTTALAVANATSAPLALYQRERSGAPLRYSLASVPNGTYLVRLHFNDMSRAGGVGLRVFNVYLEGALAEANLDVFALAGGSLRALVRSYNVTVTGGNGLQLELTRISGYPQLNGIEIGPAEPPPGRRSARGVFSAVRPDLVLSSEDRQAPGAGWAAVDNDLETIWQAGDSRGAWLCLGYAQPLEVRTVDLRFSPESPTGIFTLASADARDWFELEPALESGSVPANYLWFIFPAAPWAPPVAVREIQVRP